MSIKNWVVSSALALVFACGDGGGSDKGGAHGDAGSADAGDHASGDAAADGDTSGDGDTAGDGDTSGDGDGGAAGDGDGDAGGDGDAMPCDSACTIKAKCEDHAHQWCDRFEYCQTRDSVVLFGWKQDDQSACQNAVASYCISLMSDPSMDVAGMTPDEGFFRLCLDDATSTGELFSPASYHASKHLALGATCVDSAQCGAHARCSSAPTFAAPTSEYFSAYTEKSCGTCVALKARGEACTTDIDCDFDPDNYLWLRCSAGKCAGSTVDVLDCATSADCGRGQQCVSKGGGVQRCEAAETPSAPQYASMFGNAGEDCYVPAGGSSHWCEKGYCDPKTIGCSVDGKTSLAMSGSATTAVSGMEATLVSGGTCNDSVANGSYDGKIVLCERTPGINFWVKVQKTFAAGAVGVVIYNNVDGSLAGNLEGNTAQVPVLGLDRAAGLDLLANRIGQKVTLINVPGTCVAFKAAGGTCEGPRDCQPGLLCHDAKCTAPSLAACE
ncbi:MAG: hypothetical protein QM778_07380 [Myxococcales bacterium]